MVAPEEQARMNRLMAEQLKKGNEDDPGGHLADREADRYEQWLDRKASQ